jgi:hypothetical protein
LISVQQDESTDAVADAAIDYVLMMKAMIGGNLEGI